MPSSQPENSSAGSAGTPDVPLEGPKFSGTAIALAEPHLPDDKFGGFKWKSNFVDTRLTFTNSGSVAENIKLQIRTDHVFRQVFEAQGTPGVTARLTGELLAVKGVSNGKPVFIQPSKIVDSADAEVDCRMLDRSQSIVIVFAVSPRPPNLDGPRSIPSALEVKGSFDLRGKNGLERRYIELLKVPIAVN